MSPALQSTKKAQTNYKVSKKKKVTGLFLAIVARNALLKYFKKYFYQKSSNSKYDEGDTFLALGTNIHKKKTIKKKNN